MTAEEERAAIVDMLRKRAAYLKTDAGHIQMQWHEGDALMVARELERQASAIERGDHMKEPNQ